MHSDTFKLLRFLNALIVLVICVGAVNAQNVFIVVIDGARYSETFGSKELYIPRMWNDLRPHGTIFTNFKNEGVTKTCAGHASMLTGNWEPLVNDGSQRPFTPTVFEQIRKQLSFPEHACAVVSGKTKLSMLTYSIDSAEGRFGSKYKASFTTNNLNSDTATWSQLKNVMDTDHPRVTIINLPEVDIHGHDSSWNDYRNAIRQADSLVFLLWDKIQTDSIYKNTTSLFVTNDHGRHDDMHKGFQNHGDSCKGCRHIMLLALGPQFIPNTVVADTAYQIDIAATIGEMFSIAMPDIHGTSFLLRNKK